MPPITGPIGLLPAARGCAPPNDLFAELLPAQRHRDSGVAACGRTRPHARHRALVDRPRQGLEVAP